MVILAWYAHNATLIQIQPGWVPMQFNTALGFLLGGLLLALPSATPRRFKLVLAAALVVLGATTLTEYALGLDFGIDQLLFDHYITVLTAYPGRMAPNTALGFTLFGASVGACLLYPDKIEPRIRAEAGSIVIALAMLTLAGYWMQFDLVILWGNATMMALHTALGFLLLGGGLVMSTRQLEKTPRTRLPDWLPGAAALAVATANIALWTALHPEQNPAARQLGHDLLLLFGLVSALLTYFVFRYAETARRNAATAAFARRMLERETGQRMLAERARRESEAQLFQAQKLEAVGQLSGGIAHDFNNLLGIILGNIDMLEGLENNPAAARYVRNVRHTVDRGGALTQRLLAFSRRQILQPKVTDINRTVRETTQLLQRTLGEAIAVETVYAAGLWTCLVDRAQLENALLNLALNARDAIPQGGKLTIETANVRLDEQYAQTHAETDAGQYVMLAVSDNGTGMSEAVREKAFEPFYSTKPAGKGSGLGLSMVHGFIKQSGGVVNIYSEPGEGTSVKLYLPRAHEGESEPASQAPPNRDIHGNETILVVEDEPDLLEVVVAELTRLGYRVLKADDGASALKQFQSEPGVDLLLSDVILPAGKTGRDIARDLHALQPGLKVLYMSGYTENAIVHQGRLDEDTQLLAKPFTLAHLGHKIRSVLDA